MNHPRQLILLAGLLVLSARAQEGPAPSWLERLHLTTTGTAAWVNNLSRTSATSFRKDAATYELGLSGDQPRQIAPSLLLVTRGGADLLHVPDFPEAGNARFAGSLTLQHKFGLGPQATVLSAQGGLAYKAARYSGDSGWGGDLKVQLAKRVLTNLRVAARADWLEHNARSATFDLNQFSYSLDATWDLTERWTLSGSAGRLSGDIVANASWPVWGAAIYGAYGPVVQNYYRSRPWSVTNIYGPGWVSYNVEADVDLWSVTLAYAVSDHTSLELRQSAAFVVNEIGVRYPTDAVSLSLTHRF
jgi:hypothetical protein